MKHNNEKCCGNIRLGQKCQTECWRLLPHLSFGSLWHRIFECTHCHLSKYFCYSIKLFLFCSWSLMVAANISGIFEGLDFQNLQPELSKTAVWNTNAQLLPSCLPLKISCKRFFACIFCSSSLICLKSSSLVKYSSPKTNSIELIIYTFCIMTAKPI